MVSSTARPGRGSKVRVKPLANATAMVAVIPGKAPTSMPRTAPRAMHDRTVGSSSELKPATRGLIGSSGPSAPVTGAEAGPCLLSVGEWEGRMELRRRGGAHGHAVVGASDRDFQQDAEQQVEGGGDDRGEDE